MLLIAALYLGFLIVGYLASRKTKDATPADLILAGRKLPLWVATMTMTATWVDGGYLLGTVEGTFSSLASGIQGGFCFGLSLILGGLFFSRKMRELGYMTLIDLFEARFGRKWAVVLSIPALMGELFWSAELLVSIGATFGVLLDLDLTTAILVSATIVTFYTMLGGMWSVAYTDAVQLLLIPIGLVAALPFALSHVGGIGELWPKYVAVKSWAPPSSLSWWDTSLMLILGGIPWNCYFQRVLSCQSPKKASIHSCAAGVLTILLMIPPLILGMVATVLWHQRDTNAAMALPLLLRDLVPRGIGMLGLAAIVGAVTSSFSSSILSAGSMFSWNWYRTLVDGEPSTNRIKNVIRISIVVLGAIAAWTALEVKSVQALWFFSSDLVFVILFPQLTLALFDDKSNAIGSVAAFFISLFLRVGGGEPLFHLPGFLPYPPNFPFKTLAMVTGFLALPLVSRLYSRLRTMPTP